MLLINPKSTVPTALLEYTIFFNLGASIKQTFERGYYALYHSVLLYYALYHSLLLYLILHMAIVVI